MKIEKIDERVIYENPQPVLRSRCAKFPGMVRFPSGELFILFELGEAFEAVDCRTVAARSCDQGNTWQFEGELYDMTRLGLCYPVSETLKPLLLRDGVLIAAGTRFHRRDPELPIGNVDTGGALPADNVICWSSDLGHTWSVPAVINHPYPEPLEWSGPCVESASGDILGMGAPFKMWDGSNPSGLMGILFRSRDKGCTWDHQTRYFEMRGRNVVPFESRMIEMQPGRFVTLSWAYDFDGGKSLPNMITLSQDDGATWSRPIDTKVPGQASNLMWLGGDQLLTIHAQRENEVGLYVRSVKLKGEDWIINAETVIWGANGSDGKNGKSHGLIDHFQSLKFGQPSLLRLSDDEILAYHWCVENGLYKIKSHRLRVGR
jgi:sialidase-1